MQHKKRLKPYLAESFTNNKKQVINPGDSVFIVTTCTQRVNINTGRYLGKREAATWNGVMQYNAVVEVDCIREKTVLKTDESVEWTWQYEKIPGLELPPALPYVSYPNVPYYNRSPADQQKMDDYQKAQKERSDREQERHTKAQEFRQKFYKDVKIPYVRTVTLQCNRIYPINSNVMVLDGEL